MDRSIMSQDIYNLLLENIKLNLDHIEIVVLYHGGEPLLYKDFVGMVGEIRSLGVKFLKTVTNGVLLNEKLSKEICLSGLNEIEISLDATSPGENDFIRMNCDFYKVVKNLKRFNTNKKRNTFGYKNRYIYYSVSERRRFS